MKKNCTLAKAAPFIASASGIERWRECVSPSEVKDYPMSKGIKDETYTAAAKSNWPKTVAMIEKATPKFSELNLPQMEELCTIRARLLRAGSYKGLSVEPGRVGVFATPSGQKVGGPLTRPRLVDPFLLKVCNLLLGLWQSDTGRAVLKKAFLLDLRIAPSSTRAECRFVPSVKRWTHPQRVEKPVFPKQTPALNKPVVGNATVPQFYRQRVVGGRIDLFAGNHNRSTWFATKADSATKLPSEITFPSGMSMIDYAEFAIPYSKLLAANVAGLPKTMDAYKLWLLEFAKNPSAKTKGKVGQAKLIGWFPHVATRQWVLTFPYWLRFPLAFNAKLMSGVLGVWVKTVQNWYRKQAREEWDIAEGKCASVSAIQRFGDALTLNPHIHSIFCEGVWFDPDGNDSPVFLPLRGPTDEEVQQIVMDARRRTLRWLMRKGVVHPEEELDGQEADLAESDPVRAWCTKAAILDRIAIGKHAGQLVARLREEPVEAKKRGRRCAMADGFRATFASRSMWYSPHVEVCTPTRESGRWPEITRRSSAGTSCDQRCATPGWRSSATDVSWPNSSGNGRMALGRRFLSLWISWPRFPP